MKIIADNNIPFLKGRLEPFAEVVYTDQWGFTPELVKDADCLLIRTRTRCDSKLLEGSNVRLIATATIGMDQIDTTWCASAGITVRNAPGCNAPGVAQYVWSALLRKGFDPKRHTLGLIGCGNVGSIVREWGERLGAKVLVSDPPKMESGITDNYTDLDTLLKESDAVTLHTPLTSTGKYPTRHLIGERELALIGDGRILVNAARGPVVDFKALKKEVCSGRIRAIIDTWEDEPTIDPVLLNSVEYGTFHIAGYSLEGKQRATRMALEAVEDIFGIEIDKSNLAEAYRAPQNLTETKIVQSYDPQPDTDALRNEPESFDRLRNDYNYRNEVK
ncbi:MAG: 4-phosphoerythronate dehydrogenase [Bacteroidales bacterium]|nr:4-phosphoerythronate dehydrogenase [Bacteroidales bacterium]MBD5348012.1 4-phosphoerythronate dehydrogenase [Bacteroides sp.]